MNGTRERGTASQRVCAVCRKRKGKVHRSRLTAKLVCAACADRARMRVEQCVDCRERKLIQARGQCFACYKRDWRARRVAPPPTVTMPRASTGLAHPLPQPRG